MDKPKRKRNINWDEEEKGILRQLVAQSIHVKDKTNTSLCNKKKQEEWSRITKSLNELTGKSRSDVEVKLAWKRIKLAAKANVSAHRQALNQTGGGPKPPSPTAEDMEVMAIVPGDFLCDENKFDSDYIQIPASQEIYSQGHMPDSPVPGPSASTVPGPSLSPILNIRAGPSRLSTIELRCEVTPAPFMLRPYAGLYNPFSHACSVLCNHPADSEAKEFVKRAKDNWLLDGKGHYLEDLSKIQDGADKEKIRTPHDIVTEDMFRRYAETDSRPLTPAPTLASGKSRGSRRCLTPDQSHHKTTIVLDLRRSHSQETLYYHGYTTSDMTVGPTTSPTADRSTLPSLNLSEAAHARLLKGQCEQLPPLASPLVLAQRAVKEPVSVRTVKKNQLKALNLGKAPAKSKTKGEPPSSQRSKAEKEALDENDALQDMGEEGDMKRRGKRRRKGRAGSDRLTSAGLAAQAQQDPETQIAGIGGDSQNPSSRGSIAPSTDDDIIILPVMKPASVAKKTDSFLDDEILKYLHREVDVEAIETEFDIKRRYVLEEALRTRPERSPGQEMQNLLKELKVPAMSLGDWLHIPRVFSRQSAQFSLPIDSNSLESLTPMQYAARFVTLKKSKQLLYLTVLRKFRERGYRMPIKNIEEGLILMMGGILTAELAKRFQEVMEWEKYEQEESIPDEIKLTLLDTGFLKKHVSEETENGSEDESDENTIKYRTWCGLCAICERMYGRYPAREKDPPDGMELSDFMMIETRIGSLNIRRGLIEILNAIRER